MVNQSAFRTALVWLVAQMAPLVARRNFRVRPHCAWIALLSVAIFVFCPLNASQEGLTLQKCMPKADMENIAIKCAEKEMIVIHTAFFTSSVVDQCPFTYLNRSWSMSNEIDDIRAKHKSGCTDDLRLTLNQHCSGRSSCYVNLRKAHVPQCEGFDGWINIKYSCVRGSRVRSFCNQDLTDTFGYVSNPGYPKFYPMYVCTWKIRGTEGQRVQVDILDMAIKEQHPTNKKGPKFECGDYLTFIEDNVRTTTLCGEMKKNLLDYRSKSNELTVEFVSFDFSPTRGVLFKYSLRNCPTLRAPQYSQMHRNGSFVYYYCLFDFVFENTGLPTLVLHCDHDIYWNGSVSRCVPRENVTAGVMASALTNHHNRIIVRDQAEFDAHERQIAHYNKGLMTPILLVAIVIAVNVVVICILVKMRGKSTNRTAV